MQKAANKGLIAACGMNCALCLAYQREKNHCAGCRSVDDAVHGGCLRCIIRRCQVILSNESGFCYECKEYPCLRLRQLDKRYRSKYYMSMLENLEAIREIGFEAFEVRERDRWGCPACGAVLCVHRKTCPSCGATDSRRPSLRI